MLFIGDISEDITQAVTRAKQFLLAQADKGFPETRHTMRFPRQAGFQGEQEEQSADVFARAVLASLLLDVVELDEDTAFEEAVQEVARREARHVAEARLRDRNGGWSYFPGLPELPPDLDSLAAALFLFARAVREYVHLCEEPIQLALNQIQPDGSLETWLVSPENPPAQRLLMEHGINNYWGRSVDVEVLARFFLALLAYDRQRFEAVACQGARFLLDQQKSNGTWESTWYWGTAYGTSLCLRLLDELGLGEEAGRRAQAFFLATQRDDGGWGEPQTVPLETALSLWILARWNFAAPSQAILPAVQFLLKQQGEDGSWNPSPWIKMEIGRPQGHIIRTLSYSSTTLTTAFCLRSLMCAAKTP